MEGAMLLVGEDEVDALVSMTDAIDAVARAFAAPLPDHAQLARRRLHLGDVRLNVMGGSAGDPPRAVVKAYTTRTDNAVLVFDHDGTLLAVVAGTRLSQLRTAATTAVAVRACSRADSSRLALLGSGFQAEAQLEAVLAVRPVAAVRVWSPTPAHRTDFATRAATRFGLDVAAVDSARAAVAEADVVVTATSATTPVLAGADVAEHAHVTLMGANQAHRREADVDLFARASTLVVDDPRQARSEAGALGAAVDSGAITWDDLTDLADIVRGGTTPAPGITVFTSLGAGLEDAALASVVVDRVTAAAT